MERSRLLEDSGVQDDDSRFYSALNPNTSINTSVDTGFRGDTHTTSVSVPEIKVYKRRWYILLLFSLFAFMQGAMPNVWTVIAQSAEAVFGWSDANISLMMNWVYITYLIAMAPIAILMDKKGLRPAILVSAGLVVLGTALRCITLTPPYVTWLAHVAHIVIGLAGPVCFTAGPSISAMWFPPNQRATATAIAVVMGYAGAAGCFIEGPTFISAPSVGNNTHIYPSHIKPNYTNLDEIRNEIWYCRIVECGIAAAILAALIVYFPSTPPKPPSISAGQIKLNFTLGFCDLLKKENCNFWFMCLPYGFSVSIYGLWSALFDVNLKAIGVTEKEAGWLGFYSVSAGCLAAVTVGRVADKAVTFRKPFLLILSTCCVGFTLWFILMAQGYIPLNTNFLYVAAICQGLTNNGAIPLYYELAMETTYPVSEVVTSAMMTTVYNTIPLLFLLLFWIPGIGRLWMNWTMYGAVLLSFPLILAFKAQYKRLQVDHITDTEEDREQHGPLTPDVYA